MGNPVEVAGPYNGGALSLSLSSASQGEIATYAPGEEYSLTFASPYSGEYLVHASAGILSDTTSKALIFCDGTLTAWPRMPEQSATAKWHAPVGESGPVVLTLAAAMFYGPVAVHNVTLQPEGAAEV